MVLGQVVPPVETIEDHKGTIALGTIGAIWDVWGPSEDIGEHRMLRWNGSHSS